MAEEHATAGLAPQPVDDDPYRVYVDTNVFHFLVGAPAPPESNSRRALDRIRQGVNTERIRCVTSSIALAEEYDGRKGRALVRREMRNANIGWTPNGIIFRRRTVQPLTPRSRADAIRPVRQALSVGLVRLEDPRQWPTSLVELLCRITNLQWPDACHVAIALTSRCDFFITNDKGLVDEVGEPINQTGGYLYRQVKSVLEEISGLPSERLEPPLLTILLLRHARTAIEIASLNSQ